MPYGGGSSFGQHHQEEGAVPPSYHESVQTHSTATASAPRDMNVDTWNDTPSSYNESTQQRTQFEYLMSRFVIPDFGICAWISWALVACIGLAGYAIMVYFWATEVIGDGTKTFKGVCVGSNEMDEHVCFLAIGQFSKGIITLGQITIGVVNLSQVGVGLLASVGQVSGSLGFSVGQVAVAGYVRAAQLGIGMLKTHIAQIGFSVLDPFLGNDFVVSCHKC